jgi:hypothetical protein
VENKGNIMDITAFNSFGDMMNHIAAQKDAADARVESWQEDLKEGDCFIRYEHSIGVVIYGVVEALEYDEDKELYAEPHMKNFRPTRCYSYMCPEGEYGDVHVCSVSMIIPKSIFETAKQLGWPSRMGDVAALVDIQ